MSPKNLIIAGLGFSSKATRDELIEAIDLALQTHDLPRSSLSLLAALDRKGDSEVLQAAALEFGLRLELVVPDDLLVTGMKTLSHSERSMAITGLASASEAAALGAIDCKGELLGPRIICGPVTCALAQRTIELKSET
ncbi:MAG: cobalamin biosynthesis protein [Hyphomicrobiaceae bacterium]|nr:cobalamin biosynthesis protein [Hyphomicrobiaceae bacterium]